jgi:hypothetical protein
MIEPSLALQTAIRTRLVQAAGVTALVPAEQIFTRSGRPEGMPCITFGPGDTRYANKYDSFYDRPHVDLHIWTLEPGYESVKSIAEAVRVALPSCAWIIPDFIVRHVALSQAIFLRDVDNLHSHAVLGVDAILKAII